MSVRNVLGRRSFLKRVAALGGLAGASHAFGMAHPRGLALRTLGRTGLKVTGIGLGSALVGHNRPGTDLGISTYRTILETGVNYVDTASTYGAAETYLGELMSEFRDRIVLATKIRANGIDTGSRRSACEKQFEQSLRLLKTEYVDILHLHSIGDYEPGLLEAKNGPLDFALKMKAEGKTRFIGITGHNYPARFLPLIRTGAIDVLMVVLNFVDYHTYPFERDILPEARAQRMGILAMKVFGGPGDGFKGGHAQPKAARMPKEWIPDGFRYALSIPDVACNVIGAYRAPEFLECVEWTRQFRPMKDAEMESLRERGRVAAPEWGPRFGSA